MNSFYRLLLTACLMVAASWKISAQVKFSMTPPSTNASVNQQVTFEVKVTDFTNLEGYQFTYAFDPAKLEFVGFGPDTNAPTILPAGALPGIVPSLLAQGKITITWGTPDGTAKSLANNTTIATLIFKSKITGTVGVGFSNDPLESEVFGPGAPNGVTSNTFEPPLGTIGGGGTGGNPCSPDKTPPAFSNCPANINLTTTANCAAATWTAPTATDACTTATVALTSSSASGTCFPIGTSTVTYTATDAANNKATCSFTVTVAQDNTVNPDPCVNNWNYPTNVGTETTIVLSEELVQKAGDQANLRVMISNFKLIQGLSFSLSWDPTKLEYIGIKGDKFNLPSASTGGSLNLTKTSSGQLGFNWDDPNAVGVTLTDQTSLFEIIFKKIGSATASVIFVNTPVDVNAVKDVNGASSDFLPATRSGKVGVCSTVTPTDCTPQPVTYEKTINIEHKIIGANGEVCVDIIVTDFNNIDGLDMSISWDGTKLQYQRLEPVGIPLDASNFFVNGNKIKISWNDTPVNIENGKAIFRLCFQAVGGINSVSNITIGTAPPPEVISNSIPKPNVTFADGTVSIKATPTATAVNTPICGGNGTATANATPVSTNYSYNWTSPTGGKITGKNISISTPGIYKVTVTDKISCLSSVAETSVIAIAAPTLTGLVQDANGLTLATNAANTDVKWVKVSNPSVVVATGTLFPSPEASIAYKAIVGAGSCTKEQEIIALGVTNSESNAIKCGGEKTGKITLTVLGGSNLFYAWSSNANGATTQNLSNLGEGTYTVTITSADGKVNTVRSYPITAPTPLTVVSPIATTNAPNGSLSVITNGGTGNKSYAWTYATTPSYTPNPLPTVDAIPNLTGLEPGLYTVTVTDANGCTTSATQRVDAKPIVVKLQGNLITNATCGQNNGAATLLVEGGSGNYNYLWSGPTSVGNTAVATNLASGDYSISVSDKKYNLVTKYSLSIDKVGTAPTIAVSAVVDAGDNCKGSIDLAIADGVAPFTYKWSGPNNNTPPVQDPTGLCEGTYSVTVTDSKGCTAEKSGIVVAGAARPCPTDVKVTQPTCPESNDGAIELTIVAGKEPLVYTWQKDGKKHAANTKNIAGLTVGVYSVTITDALNKVCSRDAIVVTSKSNLSVDVAVTDPVPANAKNGSIILTTTTSKVTYTWENNISTSNTATALKTGNYAVTITDTSTGCTVVKTITVGDPGAVEIVIRSVFNGVNVRCFNMCNGIAEVKGVADAILPLKYKWTNGDTSRIAKGLCVGVHKVTVTDKNNENFEGSVNIVGPAKIEPKIITDATDKSARVEVKGGTAPFVFRWHDYTTNDMIKNQPIGRVFVMIIDANGCESSANGYIGETNSTAVCLDASPVITPNNDSYNDDLEIFCLENYPNNKLQIFNRWGQEILVQTNYQNHTWKGTYANGTPLPNGAYFYVIEAFGDNPPAPQKGSFVILNEE